MFNADIAERLTSDSERVKFYTWMALKVSAQVLSLAFSLINHEISYTNKHNNYNSKEKKTTARQKIKIKKNFLEEIKTIATPKRIHDVI